MMDSRIKVSSASELFDKANLLMVAAFKQNSFIWENVLKVYEAQNVNNSHWDLTDAQGNRLLH